MWWILYSKAISNDLCLTIGVEYDLSRWLAMRFSKGCFISLYNVSENTSGVLCFIVWIGYAQPSWSAMRFVQQRLKGRSYCE